MPEIQKGILSIATQSESVFQGCTIKLALLIAMKKPPLLPIVLLNMYLFLCSASLLSRPPYSLKASKVTVTDI